MKNELNKWSIYRLDAEAWYLHIVEAPSCRRPERFEDLGKLLGRLACRPGIGSGAGGRRGGVPPTETVSLHAQLFSRHPRTRRL